MEAPSASPSLIAFPETARSPLSPSKSDKIKTKNANHPYAIKTTSTAVLSRANSLSGPAVPPVLYQASANAKPLGRSQSRGHRHSISLATFASPTPPTPLPLPPKRSGSFSSSRNDTILSPNESLIAELPDNPKSWSPRQLSIYLASALRFKGGGALPVPVANDIAAFVLREKLGGRAFLRLSDENLKNMGVNHLWRESMLAAARTLRKKVLQGRIWGFGSQSENEKDDKAESIPKRRLPSTVNESEDEPTSPSPPPTKGYRGGRVRGMIETLERSGSSDEADLANSDARLESQLRQAGLWIASEDSEVDDDADMNADVSASSSSDSEAVAEYTHSRDSSGSQLSQRSQPPAYTQSLVQEPNEEPTVEELLSQEVNARPQGSLGNGSGSSFYEAPSLGAMAWENDTDIAGGTARKVNDILPASLHKSARRMLNAAKQPTVADMFGISPQQTQNQNQDQGPAQVSTDAYVLIQAFRTRLEAVEKKLMELEMRDEEREKEVQQLRENEQRRLLEEEERKRELFDKMDENYVGPANHADHTDNTDDVDIAWTKPAIRPAIVSSTKVVATLTIPGAASLQESKVEAPTKAEEEEQIDRQTITRNRAHNTREVVDVHTDPPLEDQPDPQPSELPSYVIMVGLGVCAVVLRVLLRRMGGQRR